MIENAEFFKAVSRHIVKKFICQNFLRRKVGNGLETFVKALIEFKNIVTEIFFYEVNDIFIGDVRAIFESVVGNEKAVSNI